MKIVYRGLLPASDPIFSEGLQVFTNPYSGPSMMNKQQSTNPETPAQEAALPVSERPVLDLELAISNFDKLQDAYEAGGAEALREVFLEQVCQRRADNTAEE